MTEGKYFLIRARSSHNIFICLVRNAYIDNNRGWYYGYKLVLMIVIFGETYNSDLMNVPAENLSFMREIYYLMNITLITRVNALSAIRL